jgi:hypothetical protein
MKQMTCLFEELDDATRRYLEDVRSRQGHRTPGIYVGRNNLWPVVALLVGPIIAGLALWLGYNSSKNAAAVALLQTAGVVLGGWMVVYAFRRWFASGKTFAGYFTYFDPTHVYQANGESVTITDVSDFSEVVVRHDYSGEHYGGSRVLFDLGGRRLVVPVNGEAMADFVDAYYRALVNLEQHDDRKWRDLPTAELGGVAKYVATQETLPHDPAQVPLEVTDTPREPQRAQRAGPALVPYLLILAAGGLAFVGFWNLNDPVRDNREFAQAAAAGAPGLRAYLLDPRNTRHRAAAQERLAKLYEPAIAKVETQAKDPEAKRGLLAILHSLREAPQPVVSIEVREKDSPPDLQAGTLARETLLRTDLADAIAMHLGKELVGFVRAPEGQPAHFELEYAFTPNGGEFQQPTYRVTWHLRLRAEPGAAPIEMAPQTLAKAYTFADLGTLTNDLKGHVFLGVFGQPPPVIPPLPIGGGGEF